MAEEKKTIGLTEANKAIMEKVVKSAGFKHDMDAAKFAFALAVSRGAEPAPLDGVGTIWNVGSFDEGGEIKALVQNLFPNVDAPLPGAGVTREHRLRYVGCGDQGKSQRTHRRSD